MKKQRVFILLSVFILFFAGCGKKGQTITEKQSVEIETSVQTVREEGKAEVVTGILKMETPEETEPEENTSTEELNPEGQAVDTEGAEQETQWQSEPQEEAMQPQETHQETQMVAQTQQEPQPPQEPQTTQEPEQPMPIGYSPELVVRLATEKTKAYGKIYIPDDLDRMLADGTLTQEAYDACYPTDGAGYMEFYVATDLNEARDVSGTIKFNSEEDIAANIAGMYSSLSQQYFYIEYHGTVMYGDRECYLFYCYRA
ncbi:MAG: hypothetical protein K2M60_01965 [Lachnospiraceae bacterium]|nr:hypothetical protein [Lachnospiraceae bacterium]MDE6254018.1 hypothetical protein [Lachnospiraceae bacterium]